MVVDGSVIVDGSDGRFGLLVVVGAVSSQRESAVAKEQGSLMAARPTMAMDLLVVLELVLVLVVVLILVLSSLVEVPLEPIARMWPPFEPR